MAYFCNIRITHEAQGSSEKIYIAIRNDDESISEFKLQAQQVEGKTEEELVAAGDLWLNENGYPELVGEWGVHLRVTDNEPIIWTGNPPLVWPEFEIDPNPPGSGSGSGSGEDGSGWHF